MTSLERFLCSKNLILGQPPDMIDNVKKKQRSIPLTKAILNFLYFQHMVRSGSMSNDGDQSDIRGLDTA